MSLDNYYRLLGIDKTATQDDIKKAYRKLAMMFHPDINTDKTAEKKFKAIGEAYGVLSDKNKRQMYDQTGNADFGSSAGHTCQRNRTRGRYMGKCSGFEAILRRRDWYAKKRAAEPDVLSE